MISFRQHDLQNKTLFFKRKLLILKWTTVVWYFNCLSLNDAFLFNSTTSNQLSIFYPRFLVDPLNCSIDILVKEITLFINTYYVMKRGKYSKQDSASDCSEDVRQVDNMYFNPTYEMVGKLSYFCVRVHYFRTLYEKWLQWWLNPKYSEIKIISKFQYLYLLMCCNVEEEMWELGRRIFRSMWCWEGHYQQYRLSWKTTFWSSQEGNGIVGYKVRIIILKE